MEYDSQHWLNHRKEIEFLRTDVQTVCLGNSNLQNGTHCATNLHQRVPRMRIQTVEERNSKRERILHQPEHPEWTSDLRIPSPPDKNASEEEENMEGKKEEREVIEKDILAISTEYLKTIFKVIRFLYSNVKETKLYRILTTTTQPAHLAVMFAALLIAASLHTKQTSDNMFCKFIYAATTAAHFGSQIWMTFASGLSLYFSLPRHYFGEVQKILFPLYFTLTSILSLATLLAHLRLAKSSETTALLTACFFVEFIVRLYLCDPLVRLICVKNEMEAQHGLGMEVGKLAHDSRLFQSQEYISVHKRFRRLHMFIAFSNIACIGFSTAHLYLSASDINFKS